jgi:hypothetical protein
MIFPSMRENAVWPKSGRIAFFRESVEEGPKGLFQQCISPRTDTCCYNTKNTAGTGQQSRQLTRNIGEKTPSLGGRMSFLPQGALQSPFPAFATPFTKIAKHCDRI